MFRDGLQGVRVTDRTEQDEPQTRSAKAGSRAKGPAVGVVIRTRDRPLFVVRALASVAAQSYPNWSIALINDGGARRPLEAAIAAFRRHTPLPRGRLAVTHVPRSVGRSEAFNLGLRSLDTEFVTCLDDDDTWNPRFMERLVAFHAETAALVPDLGGVMSMLTAIREDVVTEDGQTRIVELGEDSLPNAFKRTDFFLNPVAYACYRQDVMPVQWMLRRDAALATGGFPPEFNVMEDRAFVTRLLQHWRIAVLDEKLAFHHRRIRRTADTARSVDMNTMDNPSYDWRLYSDLAKLSPQTPADPADPMAVPLPLSRFAHALAGSVLKEMNDETSALWHKINGESGQLGDRLQRIESRLESDRGPDRIEAAGDEVVYSLWDQINSDLGHAIRPGHPFCGRLELSQGFEVPGMLVHAARATRRLTVQLPQTRDWAAVELALADLMVTGRGLRCSVLIAPERGFLFETGLSCWQRDWKGKRSHSFRETHVHACTAGDNILIQRDFPADLLSGAETPKLSLILPRQATDFRLCIRDMVVSLH